MATDTAAAPAPTRLTRSLTLWDLILYGVIVVQRKCTGLLVEREGTWRRGRRYRDAAVGRAIVLRGGSLRERAVFRGRNDALHGSALTTAPLLLENDPRVRIVQEHGAEFRKGAGAKDAVGLGRGERTG